MSGLTWNYHGLGNLRIGRKLIEILWAKDPFVVFLAETLTEDARLEFIQRSIDFDCRWVVPRVGRSGGLVLYWRESINLIVEGSDTHFFDAVIDKSTKNGWRLIGFYGEPYTARRHESWDKLRALNSRLERPWLCYNDFNEILRHDEKFG